MIRTFTFIIKREEKNNIISFLKKEDGYKPTYEKTFISQNLPADQLRLQVGIEDINADRTKRLIKAIRDKGGLDIQQYERITRKEIRNKKIFDNLLIFLTTYISGLVGIPFVSQSFGINPEFFQTAQASVLPAIVAVLTKLKVTKDGKLSGIENDE